MKSIKNLILMITLFVMTLGCEKNTNNASNNTTNTIVLLKFKTQPNKSSETITALTKLIEQVKHEPYFKGITLHVDPNDDTNILLYEEWEDVDYYNNEHMETEYIKAFMASSNNFLAGPPDITFWRVSKEFN
ncbi:hypothetical protein C1T31_05625 [Hanstruepera neustonica]|uniref:ABM domain-containing protein n=1 Tax=Hanstruepera neustonica TaxID=1445657 RepID=A0A2K1E0J6_9FLAO|nr:antibiotic biosynthesis monooxygenase [Hanstruepera neustonica]PNQ73812.1 hypothetical protein C1T31_05625 [Hanstruepera neustonica]